MKFFRNIAKALLAVSLLSVMVACEEEALYTPAQTLTNAQVYFPNTESSEIALSMDESEFDIPVCRANRKGELEIQLVITGSELLTYPYSVKFADGDSITHLRVSYDPQVLGYDNPQKLDISFADSTVSTPYGISNLSVTATIPSPWTSLGKATVTEDLFTTFFGVGNPEFLVEIQENDLTPGYYRLVNAYTSCYPHNVEGDYDATKDYYVYIHAEDPNAVYIENSALGVDWGYGEFSIWSLADYYMKRGQSGDGFYGTIKDGFITFPANSLLVSMANYNDGAYYTANSGGKFSVLLPGFTRADYSAVVDYAGIFTAKDETVYAAAQLTLGADATDVKAIVMPQDADAAAVADAIAAGELEGVDVKAGRIEVPFDAEELATDKFQIVVVVLANGELKTVASTPFEYYGGGANPWQSIGTGYFTDDIIAPLVKVAPPTYEVEIYENEKTPGLYRVMNPYSNSVYPLAEDDAAPEGLYLEVNAMDPNAVYVQYQTLGFDWGVGEFGFATVAADLLLTQGIPIETIKEKGYGGTLADGVIKFPLLSNSSGAKFQGYVYGAGELINYAGMNGKFEITLPSANAFAKNMAKARTKVSSLEVQKGSLSAVNVEKVFSKTLLRKPIAIDIQK